MNHFSDSNELMGDIGKTISSPTMIDEIKVKYSFEILFFDLTINIYSLEYY